MPVATSGNDEKGLEREKMEDTLKQILLELKEIRREMATKQDISEINNKIRYVNRRVADVELEFQGIKQQ